MYEATRCSYAYSFWHFVIQDPPPFNSKAQSPSPPVQHQLQDSDSRNQSSSNIWYVFCRIVSTTLAWNPESLIAPWALPPISVGPKTMARF